MEILVGAVLLAALVYLVYSVYEQDGRTGAAILGLVYFYPVAWGAIPASDFKAVVTYVGIAALVYLMFFTPSESPSEVTTSEGDSVAPNGGGVSGNLSFVAIAVGGQHACGVTSFGEAYCWGLGQDGRLGNDQTQNSSVPVRVAGGHTWGSVDAGGTHTCGVTMSGEGYCWGDNSSGFLGNEFFSGDFCFSNPLEVPALKTFLQKFELGYAGVSVVKDRDVISPVIAALGGVRSGAQRKVI